MDAITYCNARSEQEGLTPVYTIDQTSVSWNRSATATGFPLKPNNAFFEPDISVICDRDKIEL